MEQWRQWMSQDARHQAAYVRIVNGWRKTDCLKRTRPVDGSVDLNVLAALPGPQLLEYPRKSPPLRPKITHLALAALVAVTVMVLAIWLHGRRG